MMNAMTDITPLPESSASRSMDNMAKTPMVVSLTVQTMLKETGSESLSPSSDPPCDMKDTSVLENGNTGLNKTNLEKVEFLSQFQLLSASKSSPVTPTKASSATIPKEEVEKFATLLTPPHGTPESDKAVATLSPTRERGKAAKRVSMSTSVSDKVTLRSANKKKKTENQESSHAMETRKIKLPSFRLKIQLNDPNAKKEKRKRGRPFSKKNSSAGTPKSKPAAAKTEGEPPKKKPRTRKSQLSSPSSEVSILTLCVHCTQEFDYEDIIGHLKEAGKTLVCNYCCGTFDTVEEVGEHQSSAACPKHDIWLQDKEREERNKQRRKQQQQQQQKEEEAETVNAPEEKVTEGEDGVDEPAGVENGEPEAVTSPNTTEEPENPAPVTKVAKTCVTM